MVGNEVNLLLRNWADTLLPLYGCQQNKFINILIHNGARGSVVVRAICYKSEGRGFDTQRGEFLNLPNPSCCTRPWGLLSL
jgi:hypothetical protein